MNSLTIFVNEQAVYEYEGATTLNDGQLEFLDKMDSDMDRGLKIQRELINQPSPRQRATFVALNLSAASRSGHAFS